MQNEQDYWKQDDFEDVVAAALIACFETKPKKNKGAAPADRLNDERIAMIRSAGPYIPSPSRVVLLSEEGQGVFDLVNDELPLSGLHGTRPSPSSALAKDNPDAYFHGSYIRQCSSLGHLWRRRAGGILYEMLNLYAENDGIAGERRYFSVTNKGEVVACTQSVQTNSRAGTGHPCVRETHSRTWLDETSIWAGVALQTLADKRHCWTITAEEKMARAHIGCMTEEVKSLLYARSLPMTATGRKRPVLHLVESHKRRMRSGIDIDVSAFLRGLQVVEIGGTAFKVNPPAKIRDEVTKTSRQRYFQSTGVPA